MFRKIKINSLKNKYLLIFIFKENLQRLAYNTYIYNVYIPVITIEMSRRKNLL